MLLCVSTADTRRAAQCRRSIDWSDSDCDAYAPTTPNTFVGIVRVAENGARMYHDLGERRCALASTVQEW